MKANRYARCPASGRPSQPLPLQKQWRCRKCHTEDVVPKPQDRSIIRVEAWCFAHDGRRSTVENEGVKTLLMSTSDGAQLRKVTFQVANANKALESVSKMVRNGNRVVLDAHQDRTSRIR